MDKRIQECIEYLQDGGMGEVIGLTSTAFGNGDKKVQCDTDLQMAILILADEALTARKKRLSH